jgi:ABC-2 type transport system ATP-binding protein
MKMSGNQNDSHYSSVGKYYVIDQLLEEYMTGQLITVQGLSKTYKVMQRGEGLSASLKSLFHRTYVSIPAVQDISFSINAGEMVGFIGPNGAGKTTTLKMLAGLLYPTSGTATVSGFIPWERNNTFLRTISMVLGNKSQMLWDIPPLDTFRVLGEIYQVPRKQFDQTLDELVNLLEMKEILFKPVRNLSLGERMKCELVAGLLHRPKVMFLDEPTLGLDISMQNRLREFLKTYNSLTGATLILTSHYMADVTALCPRVILIHQGKLLYDGELCTLSKQLAPFKIIHFTVSDGQDEIELPPGVDVLPREDDRITWRTNRKDAPAVTAHLLQNLSLADLTVEDPPIEAVIDQIYSEGGL